jgi:glycogen debranching enzyme
MDLSKNTVLKENYTFYVGDGNGHVTTESSERGLFNRDTRFLKRYEWTMDKELQTLVTHYPLPDRFEAHYAYIDGPSQMVGVRRTLELTPLFLRDALLIENTSMEMQEVKLELHYGADFADLFEARGWHKVQRSNITVQTSVDSAKLSYVAEDGLEFAVTLRFLQPASEVTATRAIFTLTLGPGETYTLGVEVQIYNSLETNLVSPFTYPEWRKRVEVRLENGQHQRVLDRAVEDLRALLLFTKDGPMPAAGIPWYVTAFGRDSLLTSYMMLPYYPEVAKGTLRYLAARQGKKHDDFHAEAPGKILHEVRYGELSRTNKVPFTTYYGTVDATALFVMVLHHLYKTTQDLAFVKGLQVNWEAALSWLQTDGDLDRDGFVEFKGSELGKGLTIQSWKDSNDSLSHADGNLAEGFIAVSEVQGYTYAAYRAAAEFYQPLGDADKARLYQEKAAMLKKKFHETFWLESLQTYAIALDSDKKPLEVHNSDAGHLLWTGIVPEDIAPKLVKTLMSDAMWSGWGIRTLGKNEVRYNPVSYHNGSVWPHDTALAASGMMKYGFVKEAKKIRDATFDLAASQEDNRLPELVAGYERSSSPPVPYPVACRPQAWDAAALLYLLQVEGKS